MDEAEAEVGRRGAAAAGAGAGGEERKPERILGRHRRLLSGLLEDAGAGAGGVCCVWWYGSIKWGLACTRQMGIKP